MTDTLISTTRRDQVLHAISQTFRGPLSSSLWARGVTHITHYHWSAKPTLSYEIEAPSKAVDETLSAEAHNYLMQHPETTVGNGSLNLRQFRPMGDCTAQFTMRSPLSQSEIATLLALGRATFLTNPDLVITCDATRSLS